MMLFTLKRTLKLGVKSLQRHILRSILTMLGIVFGVGAVISMLAVGEGASFESQERIKRLGSDNVILKSVKPQQDENQTSQSSSPRAITATEYGLTYLDAERIHATVPGIKLILPIRTIRKEIRYGARALDGYVQATDPWYLETTNRSVQKGRFLTDIDMNNSSTVCVLGTDIAKKLFPYENPLGKKVRIAQNYYWVVGVMETEGTSKDDTGGATTDVNSSVLIPITTAQFRFGETIIDMSEGIKMEKVQLHQIIVKVNNVADVIPASEMIQSILKKNHKKQDYEMVVPLELLREIEKNARMFSIVLGMIAAISLLVGGIGIMNIMLASVTERTREIGIRRALGAKRRDIVIQFLSETVVLSLCGGILGLGVGIVIPLLIHTFTGMIVIFTAWSLILSFSISAAVGLIFGIYPAYRAANMDPIEALRHE
jgi:putative ABC transport system permease protein